MTLFFFDNSWIFAYWLLIITNLINITVLTVGTPGRDEKFATRVSEFQAHSDKLADTAHDFAKSGGVMDKKTANDIINTSGKVTDRWIERLVVILMDGLAIRVNDSLLNFYF